MSIIRILIVRLNEPSALLKKTINTPIETSGTLIRELEDVNDAYAARP